MEFSLEDKVYGKGEEERKADEEINKLHMKTKLTQTQPNPFNTFSYNASYEKPLTFTDILQDVEKTYRLFGVIVKQVPLEPSILGMTYTGTNEVYLNSDLQEHEVAYVAKHEIRHHHYPYEDEYEIRKRDAYDSQVPSYSSLSY